MNYKDFTEKYPGYENPLLDELRNTQFPRLGNMVYADWTGGAIPPDLLIAGHADFLMKNLLGNPHSHHVASAFAMEQVKLARARILTYFNASPDEYEVIFTPNATGAIQQLQHYIFVGGELLLTADNHNSVNGLREIARQNGGVVRYAPINHDLSLNEEMLQMAIDYPRSGGNKLFCYPAKSNYSGRVHSLEWVKRAQEKGWDVMLDAAAYLANNKIDLSVIKPDFMPVSMYKLFGYPTGVGCLLIKKEKYAKLHKKWFAGGTILLVSVMKDFYALETVGYARFEDGTVNYGQIPAVIPGLDFMDSLGDVKTRAVAVASYIHENLNGLSIGNNSVEVYNPIGSDTVVFNIKKGDEVQNAWLFEQAVNRGGACIRTGCFCNPGVNEKLLGYSIDAYEKLYNSRLTPDQITIENLKEYSGGVPIGSIRASFGYLNNFTDAERIVDFVKYHLAEI